MTWQRRGSCRCARTAASMLARICCCSSGWNSLLQLRPKALTVCAHDKRLQGNSWSPMPGPFQYPFAPISVPPLHRADEELTLFVAAHWTQFTDPESRQPYWYNQARQGGWSLSATRLPHATGPCSCPHALLRRGRARAGSGLPRQLPSQPWTLGSACLLSAGCLLDLHAHSSQPQGTLPCRSPTRSPGRSRCCRSASRLTRRGATS